MVYRAVLSDPEMDAQKCIYGHNLKALRRYTKLALDLCSKGSLALFFVGELSAGRMDKRVVKVKAMAAKGAGR